MIKAVIIDDEPLAQEVLEEYLSDHTDVQVVGKFLNGFEGLKGIQELKPDLVFLDIHMPKINGFEMLELLEDAPDVVFVTAYDAYAIKAFEVQALDYLLKPYSKERLAQALDRYRKDRGNARAVKSMGHALGVLHPEGLTRIVVKTGHKVEVIPVSEIHFLSAEDDYVGIVTAKGKHLKLKPMKYFEESLDPLKFVRVHRSFIVNIAEVTRLEPYEKNRQHLVLRSGQQIPVSRQGALRLNEVFKV
ncbi:MAG: LytTR family transcriptional regulator DNA-binding domain-containing protein [Lunatimonas sp.]|uniref:LytR/AlgR family response regulator transcription factor n=1 Tax=Lunatimonas sp. TaxID=2060141 RepID=UPI00263B633A|nr:LytTR family transcriptional regulator DNA-binding domain-containing protein [Lunatimonas sp.]MCC5936953.1 LytTR family transcriptional regulator DNA-binding domain-containing protein [Lunatimonas sp.]